MGMAMIYALVSTAQDWLREKVSSRPVCHCSIALQNLSPTCHLTDEIEAYLDALRISTCIGDPPFL